MVLWEIDDTPRQLDSGLTGKRMRRPTWRPSLIFIAREVPRSDLSVPKIETWRWPQPLRRSSTSSLSNTRVDSRGLLASRMVGTNFRGHYSESISSAFLSQKNNFHLVHFHNSFFPSKGLRCQDPIMRVTFLLSFLPISALATLDPCKSNTQGKIPSTTKCDPAKTSTNIQAAECAYNTRTSDPETFAVWTRTKTNSNGISYGTCKAYTCTAPTADELVEDEAGWTFFWK